MHKKRIIIAAVGEKGVNYGNDHNMPKEFLELVSTSRADSWTLTRGGAIAYFWILDGLEDCFSIFFLAPSLCASPCRSLVSESLRGIWLASLTGLAG